MPKDIRAPLTRRTMLASGAALIATPALRRGMPSRAAAAREGRQRSGWTWTRSNSMPPTTRRSTRRWRRLTGAPRRQQRTGAQAARRAASAMAYGPTEIEKLDIYQDQAANAPIFVFIHGGAWLGGDAKNYADSAEMFVNAGANYVVLDFIAIKEAGGDLRVMAEQVRRGIAWTYKNADELRRRSRTGSTSAAIRRAGTCAASRWSPTGRRISACRADIVKGGLCMSGMYDMKPVRLSKRSELHQVHRRDGAGDELAAPSRQAARAGRSPPTAPTRRRSSSGRTATSPPR